MFCLILGCLVGVVLGTISGLVPGIHSNTIAGVLSAGAGPALIILGPEGVAATIVSAMVTHTFLDGVPSTLLGVPDPDTVLSALPAHRLCLSGHGEEAIRISAMGSATGFIGCLPLFLLFLVLMPPLQEWIDWGIGLIILAAAGILIVFSKAPGWALLLFGVSGLLGLFAFQYDYFTTGIFGVGEVLLPLLTGLFGVPVLLASMQATTTIPAQVFTGLHIAPKTIVSQGLRGSIAGAIVGWMPGFSSGTANALVALRNGDPERGNTREYLLATSAANTSNALLCLAALYAVERMRSGAMVALASLELPPLTLLLLVAGVVAILAYLITIAVSRNSARFMRIDQPLIAKIVLIFLIILSFIFCGPFGIVLLGVATLLGMVPSLVEIPRIFCMGSIMIPVMLYSFDIQLF